MGNAVEAMTAIPGAALMKKSTNGEPMYVIIDVTNLYIRKEEDLFTLPWRQRPSVVRSDEKNALTELQRLAMKHPEKKFAMFEATTVASNLEFGFLSEILPNGCESVAKKHPAKKKKKRIKTLEKA